MNERQNHPKKGTKIKVEPIREMKDIQTIKKLLADKPRDLCLFILGINTNLRASDLLSITAGQVRGMKPGDDLELKERKTCKLRRITLNKACINAINALLASWSYHDEDKLFQGQRGPITASYLNRLVKGWAKALNLRGNYGSHTLRKTFGYIKHTVQGASLPELMVCFNHSTQRQTLDYLCIQEAAIRNIYMNEI
ncbi:tyrosine-type recombinase/integrase [Thermodesulfobacteriota bacterium]